MCHRNRWRTVRKGNKTMTFKPDCLCWGCSECRPKMKARWIAHAERCFQTGGYLGWIGIECDGWDSFRRQLRRLDVNYARVRRNGRYMVIVGSAKPIVHLPFFVEQISVADAVGKFATWVDAIQDSNGGNPISTCRAWSMPAREHSDWDLIAVGPAPAAVRSAAFLVLADFVERSIGGTKVAICRGDTLQVDRLCELIGSLAAQNPMTYTFPEGKENTVVNDGQVQVWGCQPDESSIPYTVGAVT